MASQAQRVYIKFPIIMLMSFLIALSTSFWTTEIVNNKEDQRHLRFGWPMQFVEQNQEFRDPPYPWETDFRLFDDTYQTTMISWTNLWIDTLFFFVIITILEQGYFFIKNHRDTK